MSGEVVGTRRVGRSTRRVGRSTRKVGADARDVVEYQEIGSAMRADGGTRRKINNFQNILTASIRRTEEEKEIISQAMTYIKELSIISTHLVAELISMKKLFKNHETMIATEFSKIPNLPVKHTMNGHQLHLARDGNTARQSYIDAGTKSTKRNYKRTKSRTNEK
uniref:Uncharacterized protein n=1 Tax=Ditylenchus dipsaci TaxID=166011 RepID=A0A915DKQ1_9BILA